MNKAFSSSRPSNASDRSTVRSQLRPQMSKSSLIRNHRAKTLLSRRVASLLNEPALLLTYEKASSTGSKSTYQQAIPRKELALESLR
jgi:hypothetical protein